MEKTKRFLRFFLGIPITIISFLFISRIFLDNKTIIFHAFTRLNIPLFAIGVIFFMLFFVIKSFIWLVILKKKGFKPKPRSAIFSYSLAELKRYVPGSAFAFLGRMNAFSKDVPQKETLKGIGIEAILLAISAFVISIPAAVYLVRMTGNGNKHLPVSLIFAGCVLLFIVIVVLLFKFRKALLPYFDCFLLYLLAWVFYALGCFVVTSSFANIYTTHMVFVLSFFVLGWLAGYLLFITPMGLGVRELVITAGLSLVMPSSFASIIAVLTRVGMMLGELVFVLVFYFINRFKSK